jgi:hypothetical protein
MRHTIWEKRIPTLLGVIFIIVGIAVTSFLTSQRIIYIGKAAPSGKPEDVRITNITDNSFTVSYLTSQEIVGSLNYGPNQSLGQVARDDKDQENGTLAAKKIHNFTVRNLQPSTKYYFSIISGQETFLDSTSLPFQATTGVTITSSPSQQNPITGKIVTLSGSAPTGAILYATIDGAQAISTTVKDDGTYILPLNSLRNTDLSSFFTFSDQTIKMLIVGDDFSKSNVIVSLKQINPVPTVTLSQDYDFTINNEPVSSTSGQMTNFPTFSEKQSSPQTAPSISSVKDGQGFTDSQPLFKGESLPNQKVEITIHSDDAVVTEVQSDSNGNWSYRPDAALAPGNHTITISAKDSSGVTRETSKTFIVYQSGTQVSESATPSASPTLTLTPTTAIPSTSPTPVVLPTLSPIPTTTTPEGIKTPTPTMQATGNSTISFGILGAIIALVGGLLFLLARGSIAFL